MVDLRAFQTRFVKGATAPGVDLGCLSIPRGNGKTWLSAHLLTRAMTTGDPLHVPGSEYLLCAASIEQARLCFRFVRQALEPVGGYRFTDSSTRCGITHTPSGTRLRVMSSSGKRAMGIVGCPLLVGDEPGAWETVGGELMHDAIQTAQGKPGSPLRVVLIGTLAPAKEGWWHSLIDGGTHGSAYVMALKGDREKWDQWPEIRRCNPLSNIDATFRRKLLEERDAARADSRLKARFLSYRLNAPTADEAEMLLTVDDWTRVCSRPVAVPAAKPIVGVDLGGGRAWSAAAAVWRSGRVEAIAVAPGIPDLGEQERRDRVPGGTYSKLAASGSLMLAEGLRVPKATMLIDMIRQRWGVPEVIVCDRFRLDDLRDTNPGCRILPRVSRWSESSADIRALRRMAKDGPLSCEKASKRLLTASLAAAMVANDDAGNARLIKRGSNNTARDDVAAALVLAAGALDRAPKGRRWTYRGLAA